MIKTQELTLNHIYHQELAELLRREKKFAKFFLKLGDKSQVKELKTALSPEQTDIQQLIERLKQGVSLHKQKGKIINQQFDDATLNCGTSILKLKTADIFTDIRILHYTQQIFIFRIGAYQILCDLAKALQQDQALVLLEQSLKDIQNHYGYLIQISGNVVYPQVKNNSN